MANLTSKAYAIVDKETGKLVNNLTNPKRVFWLRQSAAQNALFKYYNRKYPTNKKEYIIVAFTYDPLESSKL